MNSKIIRCECCGFIAIFQEDVKDFVTLLCKFCYQPAMTCIANFREIDIDELLRILGRNDNSIADIQGSIDNINAMKKTHLKWAEYFEANPNIEQEYIETGEWDTAEQHRNYINQYDKVLKILKSL